MNLADLQLNILPGSYNYNFDSNLYLKTYQCWKKVWEESLEDVGVKKEIKADNFSRQDFAMVITHKETVAGLLLFKKYAPQNPLLFEDSYFTYDVPSDVKSYLRNLDKDFLIVSSMAVKKEYRRNQIGRYLVACITKLVLESPEFDVIYTTTRDRLQVDKLAQSYNSEYLKTVLVDYGQERDEPSSIYLFLKSSYIPNDLTEIANELWENRVDYLDLIPEKVEIK